MTRWKEISGANERTTEMEPIGVIDIGSNSVRLVVYEGAVRALTPVFNEKVLCGLGRSVATTGSLGPESVERALEALARFRVIAHILSVKNIQVIATAAVRDAKDGQDFIDEGERILGQPIEVLSGEKEARLAAQGIMMGFVDDDGIAGDLGGGSLELVDLARDRLKEAATLPLGGLRLIDTTGNKIERAPAIIDGALASLPWLSNGSGRTFYAVGGTWRALAKLHMDQIRYPLHVMQGYKLSAREALDLCEQFRKAKKLSDIPNVGSVARARREVLPFGALVLERLIKQMQPRQIVFSVFGIREGLIYGLLPPHEQMRDPLLSFCEDYATLRARSVEHAWELCRWTDRIFADPALEETQEERRLRYAACLLSDVGWRAHPDYRGEQSVNTIAHAGLGGVDHQGRIFLALSVFHRHETSDGNGEQLSERLRSLVSKRVQRRARIIGAALRAAHMLSIGMAGIIDQTPLTHEDGMLVLSIPPPYAALDGERLRRRFAVLAELVGKKPKIRISG
ncbi:Ppx/GppA family phosphatase [Hyphomicrobium sp.]|uniref:Ppx/GppA family phosphatase n=1 Tax=Hyphomicrobium sp. TaxID=82 RepID=UPI002CF7F2FA|nr:Ppx/GppA family phosphatase [Hyphomicrobium sp.]HVZ06119.1 Ppx/GppA family phosphatase [Hyphomicrobium sp.]